MVKTSWYLLITGFIVFSGCNQKAPEQDTSSDLIEITVPDRSYDFDSLYHPPKSVEEIVVRFIAANEVQYEHIGMGSTQSKLYQDFLILKKIARTDELTSLSKHPDAVVRCYAGWALIDRKYSRLDNIYLSFLNRDTEIFQYSVDVVSPSTVAVEFYHRYWNSLEYKEKATDPLLLKLDSLTLYNEKAHWGLILRAMENRVYPRSYHKQIEYLAFDKRDIHAIYYLSNWYKAEYIDRLKPALAAYLQNTDFEDVGVDYYYKIVEQLLMFRDEGIKKIVIEKLKKDKFWKHDTQHFLDLLMNYNIFESDVH